jgi:hypothetical protein
MCLKTMKTFSALISQPGEKEGSAVVRSGAFGDEK